MVRGDWSAVDLCEFLPSQRHNSWLSPGTLCVSEHSAHIVLLPTTRAPLPIGPDNKTDQQMDVAIGVFYRELSNVNGMHHGDTKTEGVLISLLWSVFQ